MNWRPGPARLLLLGALLLSALPVATACDLSCWGAEHIEEPSATATFYLACPLGDTSPVSVTITGVCAAPVSSVAPNYYAGPTFVEVWSKNAGECHVLLSFPGGFTYAQDVSFSTQTPQCGTAVVAPSPSTFSVDNPSSTCVAPDAGQDAGIGVSEGEQDASGGD